MIRPTQISLPDNTKHSEKRVRRVSKPQSPASECLLTHALDREATGIGRVQKQTGETLFKKA
jgi:hypothetical protein